MIYDTGDEPFEPVRIVTSAGEVCEVKQVSGNCWSAYRVAGGWLHELCAPDGTLLSRRVTRDLFE